MTVGILALDGVDYRTFDRTACGMALPPEASHNELYNDLPGHPDHGHYRLFTPYVWTALFGADPQPGVYNWLTPEEWATRTDDIPMLWEKVPGSVVGNVKVHGGYLNINSPLPEGWTPTHGDLGQIRATTRELVKHWNKCLEEQSPPLMVFWFRHCDAWGHHAAAESESLRLGYVSFREELLDKIEFPEHWIALSDHGFRQNTEEDDEESPAGRKQHRPNGTLATNIDALRGTDSMETFLHEWHDEVLEKVRDQNMAALGYE